MGTQPEAGTYDATVYSWETTDAVTGGIGGVANKPLLNLSNRTGWLKGQITAILATLGSLAGLNSPTFTGSPRAPLAPTGDNSTLIADTSFVQGVTNGLANISLGAPGTVNLPQSYYGFPILHLTGSTTGAIYIVFPAQTGFWTVIDDTSGAFPIYLKTASGSAITTQPGKPCDVVCDGTNIRYAYGDGTMQVQGNLNLYVANGGDDTRTGLSSTYPLATVQGALTAAYRYFQGDGGSLYINLAAGTFSGGGVFDNGQATPAGFAQIVLNGAGAGSTTLASNVSGDAVVAVTGPTILAVQNLSIAGNNGHAFVAGSGAIISLNAVTFGTTTGAGSHVVAAGGGSILVGSGVVVAGGASSLFLTGPGGQVHCTGQTVTLSGTPTFTSSTVYSGGGLIELSSTTFNGSANGVRFLTNSGGVIVTNSASLSFIPGSIAGSCSSGGVIDTLGAPGARQIMAANLTLYVDGTNGADTNPGTASGASAFRTVQAAFNALMNNYDGGGSSALVQLATGTYAGATLGDTVGFATVTVNGSGAGTVMSGGSSNALAFNGGCAAFVTNLVMQCATGGTCLNANAGAAVYPSNVQFAGAGGGNHIGCGQSSAVAMGTYQIVGSAGQHIYCAQGGLVTVANVAVTATGSLSFTNFLGLATAGTIQWYSLNFTTNGSISGQRYTVTLGGVLVTNGNNGTNVPGTTAGYVATGGQVN